jgi:hypothetical protein
MKAKFFRPLFDTLVNWFGTTLVDQRTGEKMGRAVMICWRGRIYLFGYRGRDQVMPIFLPQAHLTYWKREIGFVTHPPPDFPRETKARVGP